jgi:hypothetical protein
MNWDGDETEREEGEPGIGTQRRVHVRSGLRGAGYTREGWGRLGKRGV